MQRLRLCCGEYNEGLRAELEALEGRIGLAAAGERDALERERDTIAGSFDDRVLTLRILDPAMGSAHFLIRACQYLAEEIATNPYTSDPEADRNTQGEASILYWKRRVAERCLYGVDVNPMAVELAKLALWLETVAVDAPLAFLDHHFRVGDFLIGARIRRLDSLSGKALLTGIFEREITDALPSLLDPLSEIRVIPSSSLDDVKRKDELFKRRFRAAEQRFENVADVWCASAIGALPEAASPEDYASVVRTLAQKRKNSSEEADALIEASHKALDGKGIACFHWELAFPEVFLSGENNPGFDVIIGNPPYDVLAEREAGPRVAILRSFIAHDPSLAPSLVGKNNLYKLFLCRALELVRSGGYVSFIVPMPLLGDEQALGIRKALLASGSFSQIHAFPQKDVPARRVFRDAKLSTALFVFEKGDPADGEAFPSVRHPANFIEPASPSLAVRTAEIPLYDPGNLTIVSCSQDDWDLAVRIVQRGGMRRLGTLCKSFQGEVNETTHARFLTDWPDGENALVLRGANVCMYVLREASQGEALYLDASAFQAAYPNSEKAFHSRADRVGFQRSAPQNNYRRVIAAYVPAGEFCFDTVSYIPRAAST